MYYFTGNLSTDCNNTMTWHDVDFLVAHEHAEEDVRFGNEPVLKGSQVLSGSTLIYDLPEVLQQPILASLMSSSVLFINKSVFSTSR